MTQETPLLKRYQIAFREFYDLSAITDYVSGETLTYGEFAIKIARIHLLYKAVGIKRGDKIALLGRNNVEWVNVFLATMTYGAVIVPILNDFNPIDAQHIVNHSDSRLLFVSESIFEHMDFNEMPRVEAAISLDRRVVLEEKPSIKKSFSKAIKEIPNLFRGAYPHGFSARDIEYPDMRPDDLAILNYTSGTTGYSKGVMLTHRNINGNVTFGIESKLHHKGSKVLSFLPLAHAYGCAFDLLTPLVVGSHITILGKTPTPQILVRAMQKVRPHLVICVPLILEKIYRKMIAPMLAKRPLSWVLSVPLLDKAVYSRIRNRLIEVFGGEFVEVIVGGAPLNPEVEQFLHKIKFPFTVGYGMTECGPLISYTFWKDFIPTSSGRTLPGIMTAKIQTQDGDPKGKIGEILVKGQNVMKGYYKNPEATAAVLEPDGWLHTGDMGYLGGPDGQTIFIRGRYKTMILTANGQNIYPEEIEAKLNNMPFVSESLVVERNGHLTALIYPDMEEADAQGLGMEQLEKIFNEVTRVELNKQVAPYERIERTQVMPKEFEKTPKRSIRRFLYT